jgi:hypothetical protein
VGRHPVLARNFGAAPKKPAPDGACSRIPRASTGDFNGRDRSARRATITASQSRRVRSDTLGYDAAAVDIEGIGIVGRGPV